MRAVTSFLTEGQLFERVGATSPLMGQRSSIFARMRSALSIASERTHSMPQGLLSGLLSFRAARIVAAKRIAYFRCSSVLALQRKRAGVRSEHSGILCKILHLDSMIGYEHYSAPTASSPKT